MKLAVLFLVSLPLFANKQVLEKEILTLWPEAINSINEINSTNIIVDSVATSGKNKQSFNMKAMALHPKSCLKALRKIQRFDLYPEWISFIKKAKYNEQKSLLTLSADHILMPFPMTVEILTKKPKAPGVYQFSFPSGMYKGLKGTYTIKEINHRCLFYAQGEWQGKKSRVPNMILELFTQTLTKIAGKILIRKSSL